VGGEPLGLLFCIMGPLLCCPKLCPQLSLLLLMTQFGSSTHFCFLGHCVGKQASVRLCWNMPVYSSLTQ
jgi:hypothetical protein